MSALEVRPERAGQAPVVFAIHQAAFGRPDEARLVDRLRVEASPHVSLVAERDGRPVGHVFVSPVRVEPAPETPVACGGLAPIGVLPAHQGRGVGGALVRAALEGALDLGFGAVFVLGSPAWYSRFGFGPAAPRGLHYESHELDAAFQLRELAPGALGGASGFVRYPDAFAAVP